MSLESILGHILNKAESEKEGILREAKRQADKVIQEAKRQADGLYQEILSKEKGLCEAEKQKLIVNVRLEQKTDLLKAKQELIDTIFNKLKMALKSGKFKKQQVFTDKVREVPEDIDFYLEKIRQDYEGEVASILFP